MTKRPMTMTKKTRMRISPPTPSCLFPSSTSSKAMSSPRRPGPRSARPWRT
uniref:Uncharacterized protein n=1 Tax=Arundo donax TaxID=35708 RepID=A0A0A9FE29_ARUDO